MKPISFGLLPALLSQLLPLWLQTIYHMVKVLKIWLQPVSNESVKIVSPVEGQQVPIGEDLIASGESSDDISKNCTVSVIANNIKPYHTASATGTSGLGDYSKWSSL